MVKEVQSVTKSLFHIWWFERHIIHCNVFIALEIDQWRQHLVTKSGTVWSHDDSAMAELMLYWGWRCWDTEYLVQQWTHDVTCQLSGPDIWRLWSNRHHPLHICHWHCVCSHWNWTGQWVCLVDLLQCSQEQLESKTWDSRLRLRPRLSETRGFEPRPRLWNLSLDIETRVSRTTSLGKTNVFKYVSFVLTLTLHLSVV